MACLARQISLHLTICYQVKVYKFKTIRLLVTVQLLPFRQAHLLSPVTFVGKEIAGYIDTDLYRLLDQKENLKGPSCSHGMLRL